MRLFSHNAYLRWRDTHYVIPIKVDIKFERNSMANIMKKFILMKELV